MKKILNCLMLTGVLLFTTGCHKYIHAQTYNEDTKVEYYGAFNRRDFTHADVVLYKKGANTVCEGIVHINAPSRAITWKNDDVDAVMKLACTDGKLVNADWQMSKGNFADGIGEGIDQYNKKYIFKSVSKKEFKKNLPGKKATVPDKEFLLKY